MLHLKKIIIYPLVISICLLAWPTSLSYAQNPETELFLISQKALEDGFYDVAIRYIEQFLDQYPQSDRRAQAHVLLGQCYFFKNHYLKAFEIFTALKTNPGFQDIAFFWLAETHFKVKDFPQARKHYEHLIKIYPQSDYFIQSVYGLAWLDYEQGLLDTARTAFADFTQRFPDHPLSEEASFRQGESEFMMGLYAEAITHLERFIQTYPLSSHIDQAFFYIAEASYYRDHFTKAIEFYAKAKDTSSDKKIKLLSRIGLGWCHLKLKEFSRSQQWMEEAVLFAQTENVPSEDPLFGLASLFSETKEMDKALETYQTIINSFPDSPRIVEASLGKANTLYALGRYFEAVEAYQEMIQQLDPSQAFNEIYEKTFLGLAWTLLKTNQLNEALKNFQYVATKTKNKIVQASALTQIGDTYQDLEQYDQAITTYDKILIDFPSSPYADYVQFRLGIALLKSGKLKAAILSFQTLQNNFPQSKYLADIDYYLGLAYFKENNWNATKEKLGAFVSSKQINSAFLPDAYYLLGLSHFYLNENTDALKIFNRIRKDHPQELSLVMESEFHMARILYRQDQVREALKQFKIIAYKYPQTPIALESLLWLGEYYMKTFDFDNAILYYQEVINNFKNTPEHGKALLALGEAYSEKGEFDKALNHIKLIDSSFPEEYVIMAKLAIADTFAKQMDATTAVDAYQNIARNSPEFERNALIKIADIYKNQRKYTLAIDYYRQALNAPDGLQNIKKSEILFMIADIYEILNDQEKAIEEYLKIPYLYPTDISWVIKAYLRVAKIFESQEDWLNATNIYQKLLTYEIEEKVFAQERLDWISRYTLPAND